MDDNHPYITKECYCFRDDAPNFAGTKIMSCILDDFGCDQISQLSRGSSANEADIEKPLGAGDSTYEY
jgi:hypothetical protein